MNRLLISALAIAAAAVLSACQEAEPRLRPVLSAGDFTYVRDSFSDYAMQTRRVIAANRSFVNGMERELEIDMNAPYALEPDAAACAAVRGGFVLFHGLSDSPFMVRDIAEHLRNNCYIVWAPLMPGHGTRPGDLLGVTSEDWLKAARAAVHGLRARTGQVHVGGFSMGGVIAMILAVEDPRIASVTLWSPAARARSRMLWMAAWIKPFYRWVDRDPETEMPRYEAFSANAAAQYYDLTSRLAGMLDGGAAFSMPVFGAISADDSVVDTDHMVRTFKERAKSPRSRLVVYQALAADCADAGDGRVLRLNSHLPGQRVSGFSHLAIPTAPDNWYYGRKGRYRSCDRYGDGPQRARCETADDIWYGAWGQSGGDDSEPRIFARLTFNPRYADMTAVMDGVLGLAPARTLPACPAAVPQALEF